MRKIACYLFAFILIGCGGEKGLDITVEEIDAYVADKLSEHQEYDVAQSLRFTRENESYEVISYMQNDSLVLYLEVETTLEKQINRQTFFKDGKPVYVFELISSAGNSLTFMNRKTYLDGISVMEAYERSDMLESYLETVDYAPASVTFDMFDFAQPDNAMKQLGNFEMKFEEFITISPQQYLILENDKSHYDVALFVADPHPFLSELMEDEEGNRGRTIFVTYQFVSMNGVERMLFIDGFDPEKEAI